MAIAVPARAQTAAVKDLAVKDIDPGVDRDETKDPPGTRRLSPGGKVWLDTKNKRVVMLAEICLREGQLEMFACLKGDEGARVDRRGTHEGVCRARGLDLAGSRARRGGAVRTRVQAGEGPTRRRHALLDRRERDAPSRQCARLGAEREDRQADDRVVGCLAAAASGPTNRTGQQFYKAEDGDFICISNFASAMLDVPVQSSQSNDALLFEALTDQIPPLGTKVSLVLTPHIDPAKRATAPAAKPANSRRQARDQVTSHQISGHETSDSASQIRNW